MKESKLDKYSKEELLRQKISSLELKLPQKYRSEITRLNQLLIKKKIYWKPHYWLSNEWFSPDGVGGIAIPFVLASPKLIELEKYRTRKGIHSQIADLPKDVERKIIKVVKNTYRALDLTGYARIDLRLTEDNQVYILEANPNPNIAMDDEFAESAKAVGISYKELIEKLIP